MCGVLMKGTGRRNRDFSEASSVKHQDDRPASRLA
jgi:hypothetical protein